MDPGRLLRGMVAGAALLLVVGAFGSWGALSTVPEQAQVVQNSRIVLATLGCLAAVTAAIPRFRLYVSSLAALLFLVAGIIAYGDLRYEENQAWQYNAGGSTWGLVASVSAAGAGVLFAILEVLWGRRRPTEDPTVQP